MLFPCVTSALFQRRIDELQRQLVGSYSHAGFIRRRASARTRRLRQLLYALRVRVHDIPPALDRAVQAAVVHGA